MSHTFKTSEEAYDFANKNCNNHGNLCLNDMNSRQLVGLIINKVLVMGVKCVVVNPDGYEFVMLREYVNPLRLKHEVDILKGVEGVRVVEYYAYRLSPSNSIIHLETLSDSRSIDRQLGEYTGDGYSSKHFHQEDDESSLSPGGVVVHRKTQQRFFIPPVSIEICLDLL